MRRACAAVGKSCAETAQKGGHPVLQLCGWRSGRRAGAAAPGAAGGPRLRVDVDQRERDAEQGGRARLQEEQVPHAQARLQRQRVDEEAEEPLRGHAGHVRAQALQVGRQAREAGVHQVLERQLVHLRGARAPSAGAWLALLVPQSAGYWRLPDA